MSQIAPFCEGLFVEKLIVPERKHFPEVFIKGEWFIRLSGRRADGGILFSVRARHPYLAWVSGKGPKASPQATHAVFDLNLSKYLKGARIQKVEAIPRERVCVFWFVKGEVQGASQLGLVLNLIPAAPEALLVQAETNLEGSRKSDWMILARSRQLNAEPGGIYRVPDGAGAPANPPVRAEFQSPEAWTQLVETTLEREAFLERLRIVLRGLKENIEHLEDKIRQAETAISQAKSEPDWQAFGDLLKVYLPEPPPADSRNIRTLTDYATGTSREIPCDPKLNPQQQVAKFYQNAKRKMRRIEEAQGRIERFSQLKADFLKAPQSGGGKAREFWSGRSFVSKDGLSILVGRNRTENLELTFKLARGNDLWLHVQGRPGAHVVIQLQPGKSAPLETLLDAANLAIHYSGGEDWGKTEVDYTFKKYVKRIKDSTEASYTHNKTLLVQPDRERMKRLLSVVGEK